MYKSYSYNNMPQPVRTDTPKEPPKQIPVAKPASPALEPQKKQNGITSILDKLQSDDMILLIVIILLLMNDCDDKLLLLALAYVFLSD